jgi:hypothetical protein
MTKPPLSLCVVLLPLTLLACSDSPPTPAEVRSAISSDLGHVLGQSGAALAGAPDALPSTAAVAMVQRLLGSPALAPVQAMTAHLVERAGAGPALAIDADAQTRYLNDQLFTDANHLGDGVFQVPASVVCTRTTTDASGTTSQTVDAACVEQVTRADLRIRTTREDGALVFALQVDAAHDEPVRLALGHASIAVTVNLDDAQRAFTALAALVGKDLPNVALSGEVTVKLEALGAAAAKVSLSIDRPLSIQAAAAGVDLAGPDAFSLTSAAAEVVAFTLDAAAKTGALDVGLGRTAISVPGSAAARRVGVLLPGFTASASFAANQPLQLTHVSFGNGTTSISLDGVQAVGLDVSGGRPLDLTLSHDAAAGTSTLAVSPALDVRLAIDHAVLGDTAPVYDVTELQLDGSVRGRDASPALEVVTGELAIKTNPERYGFTAPAGQCVTSSAASDPITGAPFTQWAVAACP